MKILRSLAIASLCGAALSADGAPTVSDASLLRMCAMDVAPVIDGRISPEEARASSAQYGAVSDSTGLMTRRYVAFQFGHAKDGFYFASRTSVPDAPQKLAADDAVTFSLLPPGASEARRFRVCLADGSSNLPPGAKCAVKILDGVSEYGVLCVEAEMFVPFSAAGMPQAVDGERWGLQMSVDFSSERETARWHYSRNEDEFGAFVPDSSTPVPGLSDFYKLEQYRQSGNYRFAFRFHNPTDKGVKLGSRTMLHRGIGFAKLDSNPEGAMDITHVKFDDFRNVIVPAGETADIVHKEWVIWPGSVTILDIDLSAGGKDFFRRKIRWDVNKGLNWKDAKGLPTLKCGFFPSDGNRIRLRYDANRIKDLVRGSIRVVGVKSGKVFFERILAGNPHLKSETFDARLGELPEDKYIAHFAAEDAKGGRYSHDRTFAVARFPWQGTAIGEERIVIPPYAPIRVDGDKTMFLQTCYRSSGVLWNEICAKGENILAAPVELLLDGGPLRVTAQRVVSAEDDRVVREVNAERGGVKLTATQTYDYDGFCWVRLAFHTEAPVKVKSLKVVVPLKNDIVRLFEVLRRTDKRAGPAPDFALKDGDGVVWDSAMNAESKWWLANMPAPIQPYIWFGGPEKGLCWLIESARNLSLSKDVPAERIIRANGAATLEADIVNVPVEWSGETVFEMGFQPSPTRPKDPAHGAFASLMYNYPCPSNAVNYQMGLGFEMHPLHMPCNTYPGGDKSLLKWVLASKKRNTAEFRAKLNGYIASNRDWFAKCNASSAADYLAGHINSDRAMGVDVHTCYFDPMLITSFWPEWEMYKSEWYPEEWSYDNYFNEYMAHLAKTRIDRLLWDAKQALDDGYGGIYYDCFRSSGGMNPASPNSYVRPDGRVQAALTNVRAWREIMKRTATLCYLHGAIYNGRPVVENHDTNGHVVPIMSFAMTGLSTERSSDGGDFQDRFPEGYTLAEITGGQTGKGARFIVSAKKGDRARQERELKSLMGFMCAYGVFSIADQMIPKCDWFSRAWNMVFDYGWGRPHVKQHFYYDGNLQPVSHDGKDVRLTVAEKKNSALLMFGNLGDDADVTFDVGGLGFGDVVLRDALTGETLSAPKVHLDRHGYAMVLVERKTPLPDVLCIYYPEWHVYPEGDIIFGKGRTEWDFVNSAKPKFKGHDQPLKLLDGNPDDSDPRDVEKEIAYAASAGIDVFVYDWYWADGHPIQHEALERGYMAAKNRSAVKFALMWANHQRSDVFRSPPGMAGARFFWKLKYDRAEFLQAMDYCIEKYFSSPDYYRKDGRPFLSIYSVVPLVNGLGGPSETRKVFDEVQARMAKAGLPPLHFSAMIHDMKSAKLANEVGFDSTSSYNVTPYDFTDTDVTHVNGEQRQIFTHEQYAAAQGPFNKRMAAASQAPYIPVACRGWDCTPRCRQDEPFPFRKLTYPYLGVITGMKPAIWTEILSEAMRQAQCDPKKTGAILINAWNEYTEGSYLMPDASHGHDFLKATRAGVTLK